MCEISGWEKNEISVHELNQFRPLGVLVRLLKPRLLMQASPDQSILDQRCVVMTHCKRSDPNRRAVKPGKWLRLEAVRVSRPVTLLLYEHSMGIG